MLFDKKEFEHKIEEKSLKKGLKLFLKNKVELIHKRSNNEFTFFIQAKIPGEITIRINAEKVLNYKCFCDEKNYCEHLSAALFCLEQPVFGLEKLKTNILKQTKSGSTKLKTKKNQLFEKYLIQVKTGIKPYLILQKLKGTHVQEIQKKINFERNSAAKLSHDFYFNLAVLLEITKLPISNLDNQLTQLIKNSINEVDIKFVKGLSADEHEAFIAAAYYSLRSQPNFRTGAFTFLISRAALLINNKNDFENLRGLLKKRKLTRNKLDTVDFKIIAEIQLTQAEATLIKKQVSFKNYDDCIELPLALAELEFLDNKILKGFKIINVNASLIKAKNINRYLDFIDKVLVFARKYNNPKKEFEYLIEKFICGYIINSDDFKRFKELLVNNGNGFGVNELLLKLKSESVFYTFEKMAIVLLDQNRLDELVIEIKKEKNKFKLLNDIGIKKLPNFSPEFFTLYIKHFVNAIADAKFPYFQQQLFDVAKIYLDLLPSEIREQIIETIKEKMIYEKHMVVYITKLYSLPS